VIKREKRGGAREGPGERGGGSTGGLCHSYWGTACCKFLKRAAGARENGGVIDEIKRRRGGSRNGGKRGTTKRTTLHQGS